MAHTGLADLFWDDMAGKKTSTNGGKMCREAMKHEEKVVVFFCMASGPNVLSILLPKLV
jgi:hypothetical protein